MGSTIQYTKEYEGRLEDVNRYLKAVADRDTKLLSMFLKLEEPVNALKYEWVDKTLVGFKTSLSSSATTTETILTLACGTNEPKRIIDGVSFLEIDDEIVLVTSTVTIVTNSMQVVVTRASQSTTGATHAANSQVIVIGNPRSEGFSAGRNDAQAGVRKYNYTQIFQRELKVSGSSQEVSSVAQETLLNKQMADLMPELLKEMQYALLYGRRFGDSDLNTRYMGGFRYWAVTGGGTNTNKGGNAITIKDIEDVIESYLNKGGDANKIAMLVSVRQQRKLNELKEARVIGGGMMQSDNRINNFVQYYDFGSNAQVEVMTCTDLKNDEVYFFQKDLVSVHPLGKRTLKREELPADGDFVREMLLGEYTAVFRNVRETLYRLTNLAV